MAPRTGFLLLALLGAVICLQGVVVADEVATNVEDVSSETSLHEVDEAELEGISDVSGSEDDDGDSSTEVADAEEDLSPARPLARILHERSSKRCWSTKHCKSHFQKPGCCKQKCVNLASDNKNCGQCSKCCNTKQGYCCQSGKCRKVKKPHHPSKANHPRHPSSECGHSKKCGKGNTCCKGKCVNLKHDDRNCGKCGRSCGYGRKCCNGCCKNIFGNDKRNCGACGNKCDTHCQFGMCHYGH